MRRIRKFALAMVAMSTLSLGSLAIMTAPASARVVCDEDGDDCYRTYDYYDRDWDHDWHERHEWQERREWQREHAYRDWYWSHRYRDWDRPYGGGSVWLNF